MSEFLSVHRENIDDTLDEYRPLARARRLDYQGWLDFSEQLRMRGIIDLLLHMEPDGLQRDLCRSGRAFLFGVTALPRETVVASAALPLFDALACNDRATAAQIAAALRPTFDADVEYEEDFLYVRFLCARFLLGAPAAEVEAPLARAESIADPEDPRWLVARALAAADASVFEPALDTLLDSYQRRLSSMAENGRLSDEAAATLPYFCSEGLALLRLAEEIGLQTFADHRLVPSVVRADLSATFATVTWQSPP